LGDDEFLKGCGDSLFQLATIILTKCKFDAIESSQGFGSLIYKMEILPVLGKKRPELNAENSDLLVQAIDTGSILEFTLFFMGERFRIKAMDAGILITRLATLFALNKLVHLTPLSACRQAVSIGVLHACNMALKGRQYSSMKWGTWTIADVLLIAYASGSIEQANNTG
jgi:hypothetical protein